MNVSLMGKGHNLIREKDKEAATMGVVLLGTSYGSFNFSKSWRSVESLCVTEEFESVIDSFRNDEAGKLCQSDSLIILFGKRLWAKSIKKRNMLLCQI